MERETILEFDPLEDEPDVLELPMESSEVSTVPHRTMFQGDLDSDETPTLHVEPTNDYENFINMKKMSYGLVLASIAFWVHVPDPAHF